MTKEERLSILEKIKSNAFILEEQSEEIKADREFVLTTVGSNGYALEYASEELRAVLSVEI